MLFKDNLQGFLNQGKSFINVVVFAKAINNYN